MPHIKGMFQRHKTPPYMKEGSCTWRQVYMVQRASLKEVSNRRVLRKKKKKRVSVGERGVLGISF